jgi:tRNA (cmo5U34)-methyltransferase
MSREKTRIPFSFSSYAENFDSHIDSSIRGYSNLIQDCIEFSPYFVEDGTVVYDVGCSTGRLLGEIRARNQERAPRAQYIGLDIEPSFQAHWAQRAGDNINFFVLDVLEHKDFGNISMATSIFTLQFLPERHRRAVCQKLFDGLVPGGALIIAEKTFAQSTKVQDMLTSLYINYKRSNFSDEEILDKEKSLRDKMKPSQERDVAAMLMDVGFSGENIETFWKNHLFVAFICVKR